MKHIIIYFGMMILLVSFSCFAADTSKEQVGVDVNGVNLDIAKSRKIEKVGGIYRPEGIDQYVERRFDEVGDRLSKIETQMAETSQKLESLSNQIAQVTANFSSTSSANSEMKIADNSDSGHTSSSSKKRANLFQ